MIVANTPTLPCRKGAFVRLLVVGMSVSLPSGALAQTPVDLDAIASWVAADVVTGYETRLTPALAAALPDWESDQWGNLVRVTGSGEPRSVVACALDAPALSASQITADGYLRTHRIGRGSGHPLWDQAFEDQPVKVLTPSGPVTGVVARSNGHFAAQHRDEVDVVTADDLWVDVGATSAADVRALGIGLLDPIVRDLPPWPLANGVAGPAAGRRASCAVVAALAEEEAAGETHFVMSAQEGFGWVGLGSYVARNGAFTSLTVVGPGEERFQDVTTGPDGLGGRLTPIVSGAGVGEVRLLTPAVRSPGSHVEFVSTVEVRRLVDALRPATGRAPIWVGAPAPSAPRTAHMDETLEDASSLLTDLVEGYGVPGHEWPIRRYVLEALPGWARERAVVDDIGNIWVEAGPDRDTTVFMAHMDEVGYEVESISEDGVVRLDRLGGAVSSAWEGQTALLHFDPPGTPSTRTASGTDTDPRWKASSLSAEAPREPIRGIFLTRDVADRKSPPTEHAWFGMTRAELEAAGVREGQSVTSYKEGRRMGRTRYVARALDDRAGTAALLMAIRSIDPDALPGKVIFAWSVHEEGGLIGAGAMARRFARTTHRIFSIDTFVSSDTPLESPHFAYAPLGAGPVLRATENSGVSPDRERARVRAAAAAAGIPLQMGLTQGGTDGTQFTFYGAPNQGLSWPGRYSHSPGEVLDLRDLVRLAALIEAVALEGENRRRPPASPGR